jgi:hypothetical protein
MISKFASVLIASSIICAPNLSAQEDYAKPQITIGNGELNSIQTNGLKRLELETTFSQERSDGTDNTKFRANATALMFPEVTIQKAGWLVMHPVAAGKPDGNVVAGYTYLEAGTNKDVTIKLSNRARSGDMFIVMLHSDVNADQVFDFVFVEDGINVEDKAVFEGSRMIAHMIAVPD